MRNWTLLPLGILLLACGGNGGGETSGETEPASTGETSSTSTAPSTDPTTGPDDTTGGGVSESAETSMSGPSETSTTEPPDPTTGETTAPGETTTTGPGETTTTGPGETTTGPGETTTGPGETTGGTTGDPNACEGLNEPQCAQNDACMPITGGKVNLAQMCTQKPMFLACVPAMGCGDAITYGCEMGLDPPVPYEFPSTCQPPDFEPCDAMSDGPCN